MTWLKSIWFWVILAAVVLVGWFVYSNRAPAKRSATNAHAGTGAASAPSMVPQTWDTLLSTPDSAWNFLQSLVSGTSKTNTIGTSAG